MDYLQPTNKTLLLIVRKNISVEKVRKSVKVFSWESLILSAAEETFNLQEREWVGSLLVLLVMELIIS